MEPSQAQRGAIPILGSLDQRAELRVGRTLNYSGPDADPFKRSAEHHRSSLEKRTGHRTGVVVTFDSRVRNEEDPGPRPCHDLDVPWDHALTKTYSPVIARSPDRLNPPEISNGVRNRDSAIAGAVVRSQPEFQRLAEPMCQCRNKTPAILPISPIWVGCNLGGDAVGTL
jgi:hypothetical protein